MTPTLPVADIVAATHVRGRRVPLEPYDDTFAFVRLGDQSIFDLARVDGLDPATNHAGCYIVGDEADEWHQRFLASGLHVTPIEDTRWGMHELTLTDPSGNRIRIGRPIRPPASEC